jgi:hypothetical protein
MIAQTIAKQKKRVVVAAAVILFATALSAAQTRPTLTKAHDSTVRVAYKGKSALLDLDDTADITLGGEGRHSFRVFFAAVKNGYVYFLFQEQGGSPMTNPMGPCGGDRPQTLIWLKTDLRMKLVAAKSEVFASCAFNGGRSQQGRTRLVGEKVTVFFEEGSQKFKIEYDNKEPGKSFTVTNP